jgi:dTDP-4-dehydrorhamnose 3,5-epimerase
MTSDVIGVDELLAKKSAVDQSGNLRNPTNRRRYFSHDATRSTPGRPRHGSSARKLRDFAWTNRPNSHYHHPARPPSAPWGLHPLGPDRLFVVSGLVKIVVFDGRNASPTRGELNKSVEDTERDAN